MRQISTQTFDFRDNAAELALIARVLELLNDNTDPRVLAVVALLVARQDQLTADPKLKPYDQREARL